MARTNFVRWTGLANAACGTLIALGIVLHPQSNFAAVGSVLWASAHAVLLFAFLSTLIGLVALYERRSNETGALGLIGFVAPFIGTALFLPTICFFKLRFPGLVGEAPRFLESTLGGGLPGMLLVLVLLSLLSLGARWLLLVIAMARANVLPRWAAVLTIAGLALGMGDMLPVMVWNIAGVLLGLGLIELGSALWSGLHKQAAQAVPAV